MVEEIKIFKSNTEPENKNHIWMKPRQDNGYDLFYYSTEGWRNLSTDLRLYSDIKGFENQCNCIPVTILS